MNNFMSRKSSEGSRSAQLLLTFDLNVYTDTTMHTGVIKKRPPGSLRLAKKNTKWPFGYIDNVASTSWKIFMSIQYLYKREPTTTPVGPQVQKYCANASYKRIDDHIPSLAPRLTRYTAAHQHVEYSTCFSQGVFFTRDTFCCTSTHGHI